MEKVMAFVQNALSQIQLYPKTHKSFRKVGIIRLALHYQLIFQWKEFTLKYDKPLPLEIRLLLFLIDSAIDLFELKQFQTRNLFKILKTISSVDNKLLHFTNHLCDAFFYEMSKILVNTSDNRNNPKNENLSFIPISSKKQLRRLELLKAHKFTKGMTGNFEQLFGLLSYSTNISDKNDWKVDNVNLESKVVKFVVDNLENIESFWVLCLLSLKASLYNNKWKEVLRFDPNLPNTWSISDEPLIIQRIISHHQEILTNPNQKIEAFNCLIYKGHVIYISKEISDKYCLLIIELFTDKLNSLRSSPPDTTEKNYKHSDKDQIQRHPPTYEEKSIINYWKGKKETLTRVLEELFRKKIILDPSKSINKKLIPSIVCSTFGLKSFSVSHFSQGYVEFSESEFSVPKNQEKIIADGYKSADRFIWLATPTLFCALFYQLQKSKVFDHPDIVKFGMDHFYFKEEGNFFDKNSLEAILKKDMGKVCNGLKIKVLAKAF